MVRACRAALGGSTGPAASLVEVRVGAASTARPGAALAVTATLAVVADGQRIVLQPNGSGLALLRDGAVVAWAGGGVGGSAAQGPVPLPLVAGSSYPAQVVPGAMPLLGCDGAPLPAGQYSVQVVVGYGGDPLVQAGGAGGPAAAGQVAAAGGAFHLVSRPVAVQIG